MLVQIVQHHQLHQATARHLHHQVVTVVIQVGEVATVMAEEAAVADLIHLNQPQVVDLK
jgi:hypothetical protein